MVFNCQSYQDKINAKKAAEAAIIPASAPMKKDAPAKAKPAAAKATGKQRGIK